MPLLLCFLLAAAGFAGLRTAGAVRENRDVVQLLRGLAGRVGGQPVVSSGPPGNQCLHLQMWCLGCLKTLLLHFWFPNDQTSGLTHTAMGFCSCSRGEPLRWVACSGSRLHTRIEDCMYEF